MKAQILKVWSTNSTNWAHIFDPMPNLLPHFRGASISLSPKTDKLIAKSGEKHKFWYLESQTAQIKHKFLAPFPTLKFNRREQHYFVSPQTCFWDSGWRMKAQILKVWITKKHKLSTNFWHYAQPPTSLWEASISSAPKTDKLIPKSGEKQKFWDFEAQIAQIEPPTLDPYSILGGGWWNGAEEPLVSSGLHWPSTSLSDVWMKVLQYLGLVGGRRRFNRESSRAYHSSNVNIWREILRKNPRIFPQIFLRYKNFFTILFFNRFFSM